MASLYLAPGTFALGSGTTRLLLPTFWNIGANFSGTGSLRSDMQRQRAIRVIATGNNYVASNAHVTRRAPKRLRG